MPFLHTNTIRPGLVGAALVSIAACSDSGTAGASGGGSVQGLQIVPVFGSASEDVSADIDWFATKAGTVEREIVSNASGAVTGYAFSSRLRSANDDGVFPVTDGEIGVELMFRTGHVLRGRFDLPAAENGGQRLEVPVDGVGRARLEAAGLSDDALVKLTVNGPAGGTTKTTGWANLKGNTYLAPGNYTLTLAAETGAWSDKHQVTIAEGDTVTVTFATGN